MKEKILPHLNFKAPALRRLSVELEKVNGLNLGQGICLMPVPELVLEAAGKALQDGQNLYTSAQGLPRLRAALAQRLNDVNKISCTVENVIVTLGSTGAFSVLSEALLAPGDEVVCFKPFYPYHQDTLHRCQATVRYVDINPADLTFDMQKFKDAVNDNTKLVLLITPNNPTGKVYTKDELLEIAAVCRKHDVLCITDEVYEYITYDGHQHVSPASLPEFEGFCLTMGSYSKTFAITGWRVGYIVAPQDTVLNLTNIIDQSTVCAPTPFQHAVAAGIESLPPGYYSSLAANYLAKRDKLVGLLEGCGMPCTMPEGAYYILAHTSERFPGKTSGQVSEMLVQQAHLGAVPATDFIGREAMDDPNCSNFLRFCYAVPDERLERAAELIANLSSGSAGLR